MSRLNNSLLLSSLAALILAGCGGGGGDPADVAGAPDAATVEPADQPLPQPVQVDGGWTYPDTVLGPGEWQDQEALLINEDRPVFLRVYKPSRQGHVFIAVPR